MSTTIETLAKTRNARNEMAYSQVVQGTTRGFVEQCVARNIDNNIKVSPCLITSHAHEIRFYFFRNIMVAGTFLGLETLFMLC